MSHVLLSVESNFKSAEVNIQPRIATESRKVKGDCGGGAIDQEE